MEILVTGGSGFIGRHLCKVLLEQGNVVWCIDNLQTSSLDNIKELMGNPNFKLIIDDICHLDSIKESVFKLVKFDQIYHLACPASPVHYQATPIKTMETCFIGTQAVLELAVNHKSRILYTSTSEIYGDPKTHPQCESYNGNVNPRSTRACYDEGKRIGETLVSEYRRKYDIETRVARIFNTYGPYLQANDGRVISNFIIQALSSKNLTVYGDGSQTRSFCYVDDNVKGLIALMNCQDERLNTLSVNIGNPDERTIIDVAHHIKNLIDTNSEIEYKPLPDADPKLRCPNIDLAQDIFGWTPTIPFEEGLKHTIRYFKDTHRVTNTNQISNPIIN